MEKFPNEGKISTIYMNKQQIEYLEQYLIKEKGVTDSKMSKVGSSGIGWNEKSYWYIKDFNKSGKNDYLYSQISKFIEPNEFKKSDYIVTVKGKFIGTACARENYCFMVRKDSVYLQPVLDLYDDDSNGNDQLLFDTTNKRSMLEEWRYATPAEVAEYNRIGKPYDVTTLKSELTKKDLQKDIVYFVTLKVNHNTSYLIKNGHNKYVNLLKKHISFDFNDYNNNYNYELATPEQIQHYNDCVQAGKYVEGNTIKSIEPWSVGTYVVALKDEVHSISSFNKGDIAIITGNNAITLLSDNSDGWFCECENSSKYVKWFATKNEAEEFAKTLVEPKSEPTKVYDYEVVHCTTQEEWDFAAKKLRRDVDNTPYKKYGDSLLIKNPNCSIFYDNHKTDSVYKFFTFKEWCDMNNYTFESHKFEVGKWYKFYWTWNNEHYYGKFDRTSENENAAVWHSSIRLSNKIMYNDFHILYSELSNPVLLEDLTEIQQYLPEGHVDKIKKIPYKYSTPPEDKKIFWIELIKPYDGYHAEYFPKDFNVGDKTWCIDLDDYTSSIGTNKSIHFEKNRYCANFQGSYFKIVSDKIKSEYVPQVGDWVKVIKLPSTPHWLHNTEKRIFQVKGNDSFCACNHNGNESPFAYGLQNSIYIKAQPHEIPNVKPNLEKGKYYQITYSDYPEYLYIVIGNGDLKTLNCLDDKRKLYYRTNTFSGINIQIQPASEEQIEWLDRCIAANKFVPKELSKDELLEIAKQKYPVGTKYLDNRKEVIVKGILQINTSTGGDIYITDGWGGAVYEDGEWAEIVDKPGTTGGMYDVSDELLESIKNRLSEKPTEPYINSQHNRTQRININAAYGIMNGSNPCNEIVLPNSTMDIPRLTTENTTDEILKILNQYMEIEIPDTMEEVVLPQLLKHNKSLINI